MAEVQWVLDTIRDNWDLPSVGYGEEGYGGPTYSGASFSDAPMIRVDRDESLILDDEETVDLSTPLHKRKRKLERGNYIAATMADRSTSPIGTEYDHEVEAVVGVRIVGLHNTERGHVDPEGVDGLVWDETVRTARDALLTERTWPDVGSPDGTYTDLRIANEAPQSGNYKDFYRHDFDVLLSGYESLP